MAGRTSPSTGGATRRTLLAGTAAALAGALSGCDAASPAGRQSSDDAKPPVVTGHKPKGGDVVDVVADCGPRVTDAPTTAGRSPVRTPTRPAGCGTTSAGR